MTTGSIADGPPRAAQVRYGRPDGRWVLFATILGSGMAFVDSTVVNIALPHIGEQFHAAAASLQWIVNGYTLSLASLILLGGSLGDRFGRRRTFAVGVAWFATASLLCGLAPNVQLLIAARVLQGVGGALVAPGSLAIIEASFDRADRARAIGAWSGLGGVAGAVGPFLGGWLVQAATWRLVFLINVPIAVLVCLVTVRHVPESRNPDAARSLDTAGVVTAALGLAGLTYGFTAWPERGGSSPVVVAALALGVAGFVGFVLVERHAREPMLPLGIFRSRAFSAANLVTFAVYAALGGVIFLVVLNLQVVSGYTALAAGTSMLPVTVLMLLLSARAGALAQRIGPRIPMTVGPVICACALLLFARIGSHAEYVRDVLPAAVVKGLGLSVTVAPLTATALGSVDERHAGVASGVNNAVARAAGLLAVAILPLAAGLGGGSLTVAGDLGPMYRRAMIISVGPLLVGALLAFVAIPTSLHPAPAAPESEDGLQPQPDAVGEGAADDAAATAVRTYCAIAGPPLQPHSLLEPRQLEGEQGS
jgi:EmrB/QacA subfamily drug resistance transporter